MTPNKGMQLPPESKVQKTDAKLRLYYLLLIIGMVTFGLASFFLGWNLYYYFYDYITCAPPPVGGCIAQRTPAYLVGVASFAEIAASVFVALTFHKLIRHADAQIKELENKLRQSQTEVKTD